MEQSDQASDSAKALSFRAVLIGLGLSVVVSFWGPYVADQVGYSPTELQFPACLLLPFLVLIVGPHLVLKSFAPQRALTRSELIAIFSMGLMASMVPDRAMIRYWMAILTTSHYFASPENQWVELFFPYLPDWLVVSNKDDVVRWFFEGAPHGLSTLWFVRMIGATWAVPLFWWLSFIAALMFTGACLVVIFRKQWMDYERLQFPLGKVGLHLAGATEWPSDPDESVFYRTRLFRVGFWVTLSLMVWNCLCYWTQWPHFPITGTDGFGVTIDPAFPVIPIRLNLYFLVFSFFINTEILFSVWVFILISILEAGFLNRLGILSTSGSIVPGGLVSIQSIGGMMTFVLVGIWVARRHLREVGRKAMGYASTLNDHDELFSYRTAVVGLIAGLTYIVFWLHGAGLSLSITALFLFFLFIFYLAHARVMAEAGLVMLDLPINAHQFTVGMVGSANLSRPDLTVLGLTNAFARNWRTFTMTGLSHVTWFNERIGPGRRHLFLWASAAFGVSILTSILYTLYRGYTVGAQNLRTGIGPLGVGFFGLIPEWINNATQVSELEIIFLISGVALMLLLTVCRYLFYWWPLHPIGLVVLTAGPVIGGVFPLFLAWLIQVILLRIGGGRLYRKAQPLFLGMLVGYVLGQGVSFLVDSFWFPDKPHGFDMSVLPPPSPETVSVSVRTALERLCSI